MMDLRKTKHWQVLSSRYLVRDRWINLRADRCQTARGVEVDPYYVIESRDFIHVVALDDEDRIVLVRQYRHGAGEISLELPGGVMDENDGSILAAAARELMEETGYEAESLELTGSFSPDPARLSNRLHFVFGSHARPARKPSPDPTEDIAVEVIPFRQAIELSLNGGIVHAAHLGGLLLTAAKKRPELLHRPKLAAET
jgi:8-oxo-dGTP pyrophosphatase MutT (NUDIX family)